MFAPVFSLIDLALAAWLVLLLVLQAIERIRYHASYTSGVALGTRIRPSSSTHSPNGGPATFSSASAASREP